MRVLLIEDEPTTAKAIELMLSNEGFNVYTTDMGEEGLDLGKLYDYDIICLDLNLPDMHGYDVLKKLRNAKVQTPVMILSGIGEIDSKIRSFGIGADDYVTKPFHREELVARIRGIVRRTLTVAAVKDNPEIRVDDLVLNEETYEVFRGEHRVELTATEFELLRYLMRNPKRVLSKSQILDRVWSYDFGGRSSIVEIYISYLRKKIDTLGPALIHTVRGVGYVIRPSS